MKRNGFTLVELAIVLMIIGLLIGGILKGQELITNARITMLNKQIQSLDAAVLAFKDAYGALPGDMANPSTRLPNCSAAPCNIAGNGDNNIGGANVYYGDEHNAFWIHLAAANIISGIDTSVTWTSANYSAASILSTSMGDYFYINNFSYAPGLYPEGFSGHYWRVLGKSSTAFADSAVFNSKMMGRIDLKIDDGKPWQGRMTTGCYDSMIAGDQDYSKAAGNPCSANIKAGF